MDGAKSTTDTIGARKGCSRQASCQGRSFFARRGGPGGNENPGNSKSLVLLESVPPKGQGFLGNANQPRVS